MNEDLTLINNQYQYWMISQKQNWFFLLLCIAVGIGLRFTNLESKPPWADEWATLVFSLGNSFKTVPLEQIITLTERMFKIDRFYSILQ